jgi:hypothetical protein
MFGFVRRIWIEHADDAENRLVRLQLHCHCSEIGVFKSGKSYMIRNNTNSGCMSQIDVLGRLDRNLHELKQYHSGYGCYTRKEFREEYTHALMAYIVTLAKLDDACYLITDLDKKIYYFEDKLRQLRPDWKSILSCLALMPGGEFVQFYSRE